jgi:3-oxoacyl-[acyl-carrier-protein] synthase III
VEKALFRAGLTAAAVDWLVLHQANQRILDAAANRLKISSEKVLSNLGQYGNTSAASIPLVLDEAIRQGRVKSGDVLAMAGFGAGLSWGGAILRWGR